MARLLLVVGLALVMVSSAYAAKFVTCNRDYRKIGCYWEKNINMDLIVNDRDPSSSAYQGHMLDWQNFGKSIHSLACRCSVKAKAGGYAFFAIRFWAECWAGKNTDDLEALVKDPSKTTNQCANDAFGTCDTNDEGECVGKRNAEYIYDFPSSAEESADGAWSEYSEWSECSMSCGPGIVTRERTCTNPEPIGSGMECEGESTETKSCLVKECPVDGGLSSWSKFTTCTRSCGGGAQERVRLCNNPKPANEGKVCNGTLFETRSCGSAPCPINGGFSVWSSFTPCSKSCGGGIKSKTRTCTNPAPAHGGKNCTFVKETANVACNANPCPMDGVLSQWGSYSSCTKSCGPATKTRTRTCNPPQHGGKACSGVLSETTKCAYVECPEVCRMANWWGSMDKKGWSMCEGNNEYLSGLWRNDRDGNNDKDGLYRIEEARCCGRSISYGSEAESCYNANWWGVLDSSNQWAKCKDGYFLRGLYRSSDYKLHNLEEGKCCRPSSAPNSYAACYELTSVGSTFDKKGLSKCAAGYLMTGVYRGGCDNLYCIEKFKCCSMKPKA